MKPSERIQEIYQELIKKYPNYTDNAIKAVMDYLDEEEEYEKSKIKIEAGHE